MANRDNVGRRQNVTPNSQVRTVTVGEIPVNIFEDDASRGYFEIHLKPGTTTVSLVLRQYDFSLNDTFHGIPMHRDITGNTNAHKDAYHNNLNNLYTGPISARTEPGTGDTVIFITEHLHEMRVEP